MPHSDSNDVHGNTFSRREALKLLALSLASLEASCIRAPGEDVRPYSEIPEGASSGRKERYATSFVLDGFATGLVVDAHQGRPTKVRGHPQHPASLGATSAFAEASVLDLYDPHRLTAPLARGRPTSWRAAFDALKARPTGSLWLVVPPLGSPLLASLLEHVRAAHPDTFVVTCSATAHDNAYRGAQLVFGRPVEQQVDFSKVARIASFDADPLGSMPFSLRWARDYAERQRATLRTSDATRTYVIEPMLTATGSIADHRLAVPASDVEDVLIVVLDEVRALGRDAPQLGAELVASARSKLEGLGELPWARALARDLHAHAGAAAVFVGDRQRPACHALGHLLNAALGNLGATVTYTQPALYQPIPSHELDELHTALMAGSVGTVLLLETNPAYVRPDLDFARALGHARLAMQLTRYRDESSRGVPWVLPASHYLESWGDAQAWDGTLSLVQPLVRPLYDSRSTLEVLSVLAGAPPASGYEQLRAHLRGLIGSPSDRELESVLSSGLVADSAFAPLPVEASANHALTAALVERDITPSRGLELDLTLSPTIHDGTFASNAWLEELPHPITKLSWGHAAMLSAKTARSLGVEDGHVLALRVGTRTLELPAVVVSGHADRSISLELGYGRDTEHQPIANGIGINARLLTARDLVLRGASVHATGETVTLARTQHEFSAHRRDIVSVLEAERYASEAAHAPLQPELPTLLAGSVPSRPPPQWAMTIDTSTCTGCGACVIACQAENNVPTVGPEEVARGREMYWLRIDTYLVDVKNGGAPVLVHEPMLCQHCEHAPCEYVCPVFATQHSPDGLNEMVYNRCVGTRFCSNNCPYKVRRFNWFHYASDDGMRSLQRNPDVTVRDRGVMEKCTYCVQRIRAAEITARMEKREIREGEVKTACQEACATQAIQFDSLHHRSSAMVRWRRDSRAFSALHELGTRPRTMYLAKVVNPNPEIRGEST